MAGTCDQHQRSSGAIWEWGSAGLVMAKQKKRPNLPLDARVARRCGSQRLDRDPVTFVVRGIIPQALVLRPERNEKYLSTSWLEFYDGSDFDRLKAVLASYRAGGDTPGPNSAIALLRVEEILEAGRNRNTDLRVTHRASQRDPAYAPVEGLPLNNSDTILLDALCKIACTGVHLVKEIDAA